MECSRHYTLCDNVKLFNSYSKCSVGPEIYFLKKLILLFNKDAFTMLLNNYVSNSSKNPKNNISWFPQVLSRTTFFRIYNKKKLWALWAANQHIRMIYEELCYTDDWNNGCLKCIICHYRSKLHFKIYSNRNIFKIAIIFDKITVLRYIFYQIIAALVSVLDLYWHPNFWTTTFVYSIMNILKLGVLLVNLFWNVSLCRESCYKNHAK